jgi:hypothetical protein
MPDVALERPAIHRAVSVDELTRFAGLLGLVSAALVVSGTFATAGYLSAWDLPPAILRIDLVTAALRSEAVIVQSLILAFIVYGMDALMRWLPTRGSVRYALLSLIGLVLFLYVAVSLYSGFVEPAVTTLGGFALLLLQRRARISPRTTGIGFLLVALVAGYASGAESGLGVRADQAHQTPVVLTTRSEVGGLSGTQTGSGWTYFNLYLVFRDSASVYVATPGGGSAVWVVPDSNVVSLGLNAGG